MADQIYVGQESLEIRLDTNIDISGALTLKMKYIKPDDTEGEWDAEAFDTTTIKKDFIADEGELDVRGFWLMWAWAEMADGRTIPGDPVQYDVKLEGAL